MDIASTGSNASSGYPRRRGLGVVVGVVLCIEAMVSPVVWWFVFAVGTFISSGEDEPAWLSAMRRLGSWGMLLPVVVLVGAAIVVLVRPAGRRWLAAPTCFAAGLLNVVPSVALIVYNVASSSGPSGPRLVGVAGGVVLGLVAAALFTEGAGSLRRGRRGSDIPPPPPVLGPPA
ncbi:MAG: hypothetical protein ACM3OO_05070 [Planctomycetaceae bacterium]